MCEGRAILLDYGKTAPVDEGDNSVHANKVQPGFDKGKMMFKVLWLMKRKDGTSMDDLINYYESRHSVLAKSLWGDKFKPLKYMRKYFHSISDLLPFADTFSGADFDLAMEMWFESPEHFTQMMEVCSPEEVWKAIMDDENKFLDPQKRAIFILEEHETKFD